MNQTPETKAMTQMNTEKPESLVIRRVPKILVIFVKPQPDQTGKRTAHTRTHSLLALYYFRLITEALGIGMNYQDEKLF